MDPGGRALRLLGGRNPAQRSLIHLAFTLRHLGTPYSRRTLFDDMAHLTERAEARWRPGSRPIVSYPPPTPHSLARQLVPGADVLGTFQELMAAIIDRWPDDGEAEHCELSGGLDSATVAMVAAIDGRRPRRCGRTLIRRRQARRIAASTRR